MPNKEEYKQIQGKILKHLFDAASAVTFSDIEKLIEKPKSEAQYHCDVLREQGLIQCKPVGSYHITAYEITSSGRKKIMEG